MSYTNPKDLGVEMQVMETGQGIDNTNMTATHVSVKLMGTVYDQQDMRVMGKLQELRVRDIFN